MGNRLKIVRKSKRKNQQDIADVLHISQAAYSYIENGTTRIDEMYLESLSRYYGVDKRFLAGDPYRIQRDFSQWSEDELHDYYAGDSYDKAFLRFIYGMGVFDFDVSSQQININENNGIIGDGNSNVSIFQSKEIGEFESVMLSVFSRLSTEKKIEAIKMLYDLSKTND